MKNIKNKTHLVIGVGQVGSAIANILNANTFDIDNNKSNFQEIKYKVLDICFPYSKDFLKKVYYYQKKFQPKITIIHSTVPVGTSEKTNAVCSPCRGVHPYLEEGIKTFVKYFGGKDAKKASSYFSNLGITTKVVGSSQTIEALKLWDTTIYGWNIILEKKFMNIVKNII